VGGGTFWSDPIDLSQWTTMFVAFKSSDPSFVRFDICLQSGDVLLIDNLYFTKD
jgi:hypothetical protein